MKENNTAFLREELERQPTSVLDDMLHEELKKQRPDGGRVRLILQVLRAREADVQTRITPEEHALAERLCRMQETGFRLRGWAVKAASLVLILGLLFSVMPQDAQAENFFERLTSWADEIFELFSSGASNNVQPEYEFTTDHPGLQQVYEAIAELGVAFPVVPTWIPDGYALADLEKIETPARSGIEAGMAYGDQIMILKVDVYENGVSREFQKDQTEIVKIEIDGIAHYVMRNNDRWAVVWAKDNVECFLTIDCQEDTLKEILGSIYEHGG